MSGVGYFAQLGAAALFKCALVLPASGIWHADAEMASDLPLTPGPQVLMLAGTSYTCAIVRQVDFAGVRSVRLVGGLGGWRMVVPPKQYSSAAGVPLAVVLSDLAATVKESPPVVDPSLPPNLGTGYVRQGGLASLALQQLLGGSWYVSSAGIVQTAPVLPVPILSPFQAIRVQGAPGIYEIATDFPADWTPGKLFVGPTVTGTINRVMHTATGTKLRTEVMVP